MTRCKVVAPFTEDQVNSLNDYQTIGPYHPFTCGNDNCHHITLIATRDGWECPNCHKWRQNWCHPFMADWSWKL
jgi:hypothetical protein